MPKFNQRLNAVTGFCVIMTFALLVFEVLLSCFVAGAAHAAQYVIHPSGANGSNCAAFTGGAATALDTNDTDTSYASTGSSTCDLYMDMDDPVAPPGSINWVSVTAVVRDTSAGTASTTFQVGIKLGASTTVTGNYSSPDNYTAYTSPQWTTKPGGGAWAWADITSLIAFVDKNQANTVILRVTELYITVDYAVTANLTGVSAAPNPFDPNTQSSTISYTLADYGAAGNDDLLWVRIYDGSNTLIRALVSPTDTTTPNKAAGVNSDAWNGRNDASAIVANGTYAYHIDAAAWMKNASTAGQGAPYDVAALPTVYDTLYMVTGAMPFLYKSIDGGATWAGVAFGGNANTYAVAASSDGKKIFTAVRDVSGTGGVRLSTDYGVTWTLKNPGNSYVVDVACDSTGATVYALVNQNAGAKKIYKSTDSGGSWTDITGATLSDPWGIACTPGGSMVMVVDQTSTPTTSSKLYKSVNGGSTWTTAATLAYGTALGQVSYPYQIAIDSDGGYYIADRGNHRVQKFDAQGVVTAAIGGTAGGAGNYQFSAGTAARFGIGIVNYDDQHILWAADVGNTRLQKFAISDYASPTDIIVCSTGCTDSATPATISDLAVGVVLQTSVELTWTAPGDDGATGTATLYDIRYSTIPITTENWFSSMAVAGPPTPATGGTAESFAVSGLNPGTTYYFAIKSRDDANNWSGLSNVASATTEPMLAKAMVVYSGSSSPGAAYPKDRRWSGSGWSNEYYLPAVATTSPLNVVVRTSPAGNANERVAGVKDQGGRLYLYSWKGLDWASGVSGGIALTANNYRPFDIAYEQNSGRAIAVYSTSAAPASLAYRIWDGAAWSAETAITVARTAGNIYWVRLEPKPGSNEIMAAWSDAANDMSAAVWDGAGVWTEKAAALTVGLQSTTTQVWDVAYETNSGKCMIAYMDTNGTPKYYTYAGGTWTGPLSASALGSSTSAPDFLRLVADPRSTSGKIVMGVSKDTANTLEAELWDGVAWNAAVVVLTTNYSANSADKRAFDLAWENESGRVMAVYANGNANARNGQYRLWDGVTWAGANWSAEANLPSGAGLPEWIQLRSDLIPTSHEIMAGLTDSYKDLNIHRWNGSTWLGRQELSQNVSTVAGENFMFAYRIDTPPDISVSDPQNGQLLSGALYTVKGSSSDDYDIYLAEVRIARDSAPVTYWTGGQWVTTETWLRATNTLSWSYVWQLPSDNGAYTYTITARATDDAGLVGPVSTPVTGVKVYTIGDPLTVYRTAATVDSSTQITANAWFSGDGNGDSSTRFETGPSATGPWTDQGSLATETADQQYFLRQKAIGGLTAGTTYYIRITHTDADGVSGTNPSVIGPYTTKTNGTTVTAITANVDDCNSVTVSAYYSNDGDSDGTTAFHYSTDGSSWTAAPGCGAVAGASPRTCTVTGLTSNTSYYFKATFSDADGLAGTNPITTPLTNPSPYKTLATCLTKGTTVGALSVDNTSCRQLTVRAGFTGDDDNDGSTLVEFKKTADSTWSTACTAMTGGSPRTCYVTDIFGLTASTSYDLRVTWTDADGITGTNPQTTAVSTPACAAVDTFPPTVTIFRPMDGATVSGNATYPVRVEVAAYDRGGLNASTVKIIVDGTEYAAAANPNVSGNYYYDWPPAATGYHKVQGKAADNAGNVGYSQTFRVYVNSISTDSSGMFTGDGKLLVRENTSQLCFDCHGGIQTHSSQNLSPKYGNWAIDCRTCHQPHNTANIFLVRPVIQTPNSGAKTVDFRNTTGQADYSYATKTTPGNGPCEVCHTKTRNGDDSGRYRNTGTGPGPKGDSHFTDQACTDCHKHTQGFSPVSAGNLTCGTCHPDRWTAMNGKTTEYHMYMQNSDTTAITGGIGAGGKYPSKSQFGAGDKESDHRRCLMCHADMDVFHYKNNPNTPGVSYNIRVSIDVAPDPADPSTYTNKDFDGTRADGGICFSCHRYQQTKNTDKIKNDGTTVTPAWDLDKFKAGTHNYSITTTFKADNSTFNATCVKCHTDTMTKDYQSSKYKVGAHSGTTRSYLSNINHNATLVETTKNSLEENMCFQCHSMSIDGPNNYNPNGYNGVSGTGKDGYNVQTMANKAQRIKFLFSKDSSHPIDGAPPYDTLNGLGAAAGRHRVDEGINAPSGVQVANWNPAASRHVECMDCHNPHATNATPRNMITWRSNLYHTTTTDYGSGANGIMSGGQVVEGSFGGQIGGANFGSWGVEPTYAAGVGGAAPTSFTKVASLDSSNMMYQLCFKCHSIYAYGNTRPQIPWGSSAYGAAGTGDVWGGLTTSNFSWGPGQESDLSVDFNPYNYGMHPILRRGRNQPAPHLNTNWPFFNGGAGNQTGSNWWVTAAVPATSGTVNYNATTRVVTIATGNNFPTYYLQPGWKIQLTQKRPTAPADTVNKTDYWYEIKTVDSATQLTLVSGPAGNQTGALYNISAGLGWAFVPPFGPWSTISCGDCHQSGDPGDPAGPHGSDNPWILREINYYAQVDNDLDGSITGAKDYINTGTGVAGDSTGWTKTTVICYSCHRRDVYGYTARNNGTNSGEAAMPFQVVDHSTTYSRYADGHVKGGEEDPSYNAFGIWCLNCHGGDSIGGIHGTSRGVGTGGTTTMGIRLRNGAASLGHTISAGGGSCWTKGSTDSINTCTIGHSGGGQGTYSAGWNYIGTD